MQSPISWTSRLLPTLQEILLNGQKLPGWASVLKTFTYWNPQQFGYVFKSAGPWRFQLNPCALHWPGAALLCLWCWTGLKTSHNSPSVVNSLLFRCLKSICDGCKTPPADASCKSCPLIQKGWQERNSLSFHPSLAKSRSCCACLIPRVRQCMIFPRPLRIPPPWWPSEDLSHWVWSVVP